ncbi:MAG: 50S ribosomal protein L5 [Thermoprotei archaeon]|nr:MAG: 50S ribosomal protein L5 [Thermoprotei archaeon]
MRKVVLGKVVVNMAVGESGERLANAAKVLEQITGQRPSFRRAKKTIKEFGIRRGENIACIVTLRGDRALSFLKKALEAVDYTISRDSIDKYGNFAFGVKEHIHLPGVKYDPEIGIFGFDVIVSLERPGYRIMRRRRKRAKIPEKHRVTKEEAIRFIEKILGARVV